MDNLRPLLFAVIAILSFWLWQSWQVQNAPPSSPVTTGDPGQQPNLSSAPPPGQSPGDEATPAPPAAASGTSDGPLAASSGAALKSAGTVQVETDVLRLRFDRRQSDLVGAELLTYPVSVDRPDEPFLLMNDTYPNVFMAQPRVAGLAGAVGVPKDARFETDRDHYQLGAADDELVIPFRWRGDNGLEVQRDYRLKRGSFEIAVDTRITNHSDASWQGHVYRQIQRTQIPEGSGDSAFIHTYMGGVIYSPEEKYEKIDFADIADQDLSRAVNDGWIAMIQHYFLTAWVPPKDTAQHFYTRELSGSRYLLGMSSPGVTIAPGDSERFTSTLWVGPKLQDQMAAIAPGLELTADYGWLTIISKPLFWLLSRIHDFLGNWGWAIIVLTLLIKLAFYKLSETSYRSMANMRRLAPRLQSLKERFGDDKAKLQQEMMAIYKKEKINPLGGCLPILVQIPVFIALYWVLLESVELRQAPWIGWINDLSIKDPYFVLPVLMGISMFIQHKLNPQPPDPVQAKIMMALPLIFTVFFAFFPAGLVLYWVVNNTLSILQQWYITRKVEAAAAQRN